MPPLDPAVLSRRDEIVAGLRGDSRRGACDLGGGRAPRLRDRRADRLSRRAAGGGAAGSTEEVSAVLAFLNGTGVKVVARGAGTSLSGGALPSADCRRRRPRPDEPHPRHRLRQPRGTGRGRRHQHQHHQRRVGARLLLRARPVEPARLHDRRQYRHEFRRRPLPEIRRHHQQRARRQDGADRRHRHRSWAAAISMRPATTARPHRRLGGPARHRHRGDGAHSSRGGRRAADADGLRQRPRRPAAASPRSSAPASCRSRSNTWTGRRSRSARRSPMPAIRSMSRRC